MNQSPNPITAPNDYLDPSREIVHFKFTYKAGEYSEEIRTARPNNRSNVLPAQGCVVVLDESSIGLSSLYELSPIRLTQQLRNDEGVVATFGYCERSSLNKARCEFRHKASERMADVVEELRRSHANAESTLSAIRKDL